MSGPNKSQPDNPPALRTRSRTQSTASGSTLDISSLSARPRSTTKSRLPTAIKQEEKDPAIPGSGTYLCRCPKHGPAYVSKTTYYNHLRAMKKQEAERDAIEKMEDEEEAHYEAMREKKKEGEEKEKVETEVFLAETFYRRLVHDAEQRYDDSTLSSAGPGSNTNSNDAQPGGSGGEQPAGNVLKVIEMKEEVLEALKKQVKEEVSREVQQVVDKAVDRFVERLTGADHADTESSFPVSYDEGMGPLGSDRVESSSPHVYYDDFSDIEDQSLGEQTFATAATALTTDTVDKDNASKTVPSPNELSAAQTPVNDKDRGDAVGSSTARRTWRDARPTPSFDPKDPFHIPPVRWEALRTASKRKRKSGHMADTEERGFIGKSVGSGKRSRAHREPTR